MRAYGVTRYYYKMGAHPSVGGIKTLMKQEISAMRISKHSGLQTPTITTYCLIYFFETDRVKLAELF
ncbi:MAG: hypothetical protein BMS9Abin05_0469 [Rhodothermia bacterium]|nr:MAG: hypothetical protein BMS9Abin05_0469 [Rhodothermia bacterium]